MLEEILKELEEIKKHKWAPSLSVVSMIEKLALKVESALQQMEKPIEKVEEKTLKKKQPEPSIYIPNGGVDVKKPKKGE